MHKPLTAALFLALTASIVHADTPPGAKPGSCNRLIGDMIAYARENPDHRAHVVWTTNYFTQAVRYAGISDFLMSAQGANAVFGQGVRQRKFLSGAGPQHPETENVSLLVRDDLTVTLQGIYGPFPVTCSAGKFAVAYTGDSVETFSFKFPTH